DSLGLQETLDVYLESLSEVPAEAPKAAAPTQAVPDSYEEAPVFHAIINPSTYVGKTPDYLSFARVTYGGDKVEVTYDARAVNIKKAGRYKITYKAVGSNGREAKAQAFVNVSKTNPSTVMEAADKILKEITTNKMTKRQKARAIYDWIKENIKYVAAPVKTDTLTGAYNAFRKRSGDCFAYYAASEVLLSRIGVENLRVNRSIPPGDVAHYWNMVYIDGAWRHFDTTPFSVTGSWETFLFSESIAQKLTYERGGSCYVYNASLYPKVVWE
ncbi:MAG: transglutaminase-like domain-containing protein, partial [Clostridiales bacterium]|nr:transglutaminase-like domain-containing protein [Clostridiales bacterium]